MAWNGKEQALDTKPFACFLSDSSLPGIYANLEQANVDCLDFRGLLSDSTIYRISEMFPSGPFSYRLPAWSVRMVQSPTSVVKLWQLLLMWHPCGLMHWGQGYSQLHL